MAPSSIAGSVVRAGEGIGIGGTPAGIGSVVGGIGGFGAVVAEFGLNEGLTILGLRDLEGLSAVEVAAAIADHLAESLDGVNADLMRDAVREAVLEAAELGEVDGLEDLEKGLESFLQTDGVLGLVALVLEKFVFNAIWACIEDHAQLKAPTREEFEALLIAVQGVCESEVRKTISDVEESGELESVDWFGPGGDAVGSPDIRACGAEPPDRGRALMFVRYAGPMWSNYEYVAALESDDSVVIDSLSPTRNVSASFHMYGRREGPLQMRWPPGTRDLFDLAALVYIADELSPRPETWLREMDLYVPVEDVEKWRAAGSALESLLGFLTGDRFSVTWSPGRRLAPFGSHNLMLPRSGYDSVCLFSGGLDSLTGAFGLLEKGRRVLLVGHRSDGQAAKAQNELYRALQARFGRQVDLVQCSLARSRIDNPKFTLPRKADENHRSRSFLFLALGVAVAAAVQAEELVLAENGLIALNPPLGPSRVGSLTTRTAHPRYLLDFVRFVRAIDAFQGWIWNPLLYDSKIDLLADVQEWQIPLVRRSVSCAHGTTSVRWDGVAGVKHCGHCVPCIYRRAAMMSAGLDDRRDYVDDVFGNLDALSPKRQQDMRMLLGFARRVGQASTTQLRSLVVSHGAFPAACGGTIGPFESTDYAPWGEMLARWAREFLDFVG